jgi:hypothetical protein
VQVLSPVLLTKLSVASVSLGEAAEYIGITLLELVVFAMIATFVYLLAQRPAESPVLELVNKVALGVGAIAAVLFIVADRFDVWGETEVLNEHERWTYIVAGFAAGFLLLLITQTLIATRTRALFIATVTAASIIALYFHFLRSETRIPILLFFWSLIFGAAIYALLFPEVLRLLLGETHRVFRGYGRARSRA